MTARAIAFHLAVICSTLLVSSASAQGVAGETYRDNHEAIATIEKMGGKLHRTLIVERGLIVAPWNELKSRYRYSNSSPITGSKAGVK